MNDITQIRTAIPEDLIAITELFRKTILSVNIRDYSLQQVQVWSAGANNKDAWLKKIYEQYFLCAFTENELTGFASLDKKGYLDLMYVNKDWQERGVASELYKELEGFALKINLGKIYSDVSITAKPFFEKQGFELVTEQRKMIGEIGFINFRMEKQLFEI